MCRKVPQGSDLAPRSLARRTCGDNCFSLTKQTSFTGSLICKFTDSVIENPFHVDMCERERERRGDNCVFCQMCRDEIGSGLCVFVWGPQACYSAVVSWIQIRWSQVGTSENRGVWQRDGSLCLYEALNLMSMNNE